MPGHLSRIGCVALCNERNTVLPQSHFKGWHNGFVSTLEKQRLQCYGGQLIEHCRKFFENACTVGKQIDTIEHRFRELQTLVKQYVLLGALSPSQSRNSEGDETRNRPVPAKRDHLPPNAHPPRCGTAHRRVDISYPSNHCYLRQRPVADLPKPLNLLPCDCDDTSDSIGIELGSRPSELL